MQEILLETDRLQFRRMNNSDLGLLNAIFNDIEIMKYLGSTWSVDLIKSTLNEWIEEWGNNNYYYGVLQLKQSKESIGIVGFTENTNPEETGIEFSWFVLKKHQNKGYATEITEKLIDFIFITLHKERIFAETHPDNLSSNHILKKLGFNFIREKATKIDYLPKMDRQVIWDLTKINWNEYKHISI